MLFLHRYYYKKCHGMQITKMQINTHHNVAQNTSDSVPVQKNSVRSLLTEDHKGLRQKLQQNTQDTTNLNYILC